LLFSTTSPSQAAAAEAVRVIRDLAYLPDGAKEERHRLDLYLPPGNGFPVLVSLHGGALMYGGKGDEEHVGRRFASAGVAVAVAGYRLTPAVAHPAHVEDAAAAFAWVKRHIAEHGGRADQVFLAGHSAGAYLAALLATDARWLGAHGLSPADVRGVVPVSAFYFVERSGVAPDRNKRVWGRDPAAWKEASPGHHVGAGVPPVLILHADGDEAWRRQQANDMAAALRKAGNRDVEIVLVSGRSHTGVWTGLEEAGDEVGERILAFVKKRTASPASR